MNLRLFSLALMISALPTQPAQASVLNHADYKAIENVSDTGEVFVRLKLSKSGKAKLRRLKNQSAIK